MEEKKSKCKVQSKVQSKVKCKVKCENCKCENKLTLGQKRVGVILNTTDNTQADYIKQKSAELIDLLESMKLKEDDGRNIDFLVPLISFEMFESIELQGVSRRNKDIILAQILIENAYTYAVRVSEQ